MKRKIFFISFVFAIFTILTSCVSNDAKKSLCDFLLQDGYQAEFDFCITENGQQKLCGSAQASKNENLQIAFSSPDILSGLSVNSDADGKADTIIFNYYGMKAPLPSGALSDINRMMSFFSDEMASVIFSLPRKAVIKPDRSLFELPEGNDDIRLVSFVQNESDAFIIYDAATGYPIQYTAATPQGEITLKFTKIKR